MLNRLLLSSMLPLINFVLPPFPIHSLSHYLFPVKSSSYFCRMGCPFFKLKYPFPRISFTHLPNRIASSAESKLSVKVLFDGSTCSFLAASVVFSCPMQSSHDYKWGCGISERQPIHLVDFHFFCCRLCLRNRWYRVSTLVSRIRLNIASMSAPNAIGLFPVNMELLSDFPSNSAVVYNTMRNFFSSTDFL